LPENQGKKRRAAHRGGQQHFDRAGKTSVNKQIDAIYFCLHDHRSFDWSGALP